MNCRSCKESFDVDARRLMRCGWERPTDQGVAWLHAGQDEDRPDTCPGYLCGLPEVIEVSRARLHWSKGSLRDWSWSRPTQQLVQAIETLEVASNQAESWAIQNPEKGKS